MVYKLIISDKFTGYKWYIFRKNTSYDPAFARET